MAHGRRQRRWPRVRRQAGAGPVGSRPPEGSGEAGWVPGAAPQPWRKPSAGPLPPPRRRSGPGGRCASRRAGGRTPPGRSRRSCCGRCAAARSRARCGSRRRRCTGCARGSRREARPRDTPREGNSKKRASAVGLGRPLWRLRGAFPRLVRGRRGPARNPPPFARAEPEFQVVASAQCCRGSPAVLPRGRLAHRNEGNRTAIV